MFDFPEPPSAVLVSIVPFTAKIELNVSAIIICTFKSSKTGSIFPFELHFLEKLP